ncbi:EAL domain-containing protein [Blastococcus sp. TF02A-26]|uniref:sensor domain-containing phosphodiesterase n=1 Tax=Blastococcus sp. TF02A-26 TaxID=2250577 RepID=UPI000DEB6DD6|nr:EAL domain-containing protein [Blastococcus sp. TF02A-26]RBY82310.1 EAL domain-containing protein [Blastococcus sp. TF02A-26]
MTDPYIGDPWVRQLLDAARARLRTDVAYLSEFTPDQQVVTTVVGDPSAVPIRPGVSAPIEDTYCIRVLSGELPPVVTAARRDPRTRELPVTGELGIGSYVGAPVRTVAGDRTVGMLCCVGREENAALDADSARFVEFLAELLGQHLGAAAAEEGGWAAPGPDEIRAVFQPVVDLRTEDVVGYEALSRFPAGPTGRVFAAAARAGRSVELELLALRTALSAARHRPLDVPMAVNLSPEALTDREVLDVVLAAAGDRIEVEVTEHRRVDDYPALLAARRELRQAGVPVAVDDAGAGYASLQHVLKLEPEVIKLDGALVTGVDHDPAKQALVAAMQAFARDVGAVVVAEGVEAEGEHLALVERGVACGQGWLFGRPEPFGVS